MQSTLCYLQNWCLVYTAQVVVLVTQQIKYFPRIHMGMSNRFWNQYVEIDILRKFEVATILAFKSYWMMKNTFLTFDLSCDPYLPNFVRQKFTQGSFIAKNSSRWRRPFTKLLTKQKIKKSFSMHTIYFTHTIRPELSCFEITFLISNNNQEGPYQKPHHKITQSGVRVFNTVKRIADAKKKK